MACSKENTQSPAVHGEVSITGTRQEVKQAKVKLKSWSAFSLQDIFLRVNVTHVVVLQEMILQNVKEDMMVRTKISQSSALRQKRHHTATSQTLDCVKTESALGLNNNGPIPYTDRNTFVHTNGTTGDTKLKKLNVPDDQEEDEDSFISESLSEVSKFES